jgi:hypothetical protein
MALEHQSAGLVFRGSADRETDAKPATAIRPQEPLAELASDDPEDIWRLSRQLQQEWRRERYSRLLTG